MSTLFGDQNPGLSASQLYQAVVVDNNDPEKLGKIRARVSQIFDGIDDDNLPWAIPTFGHVDGATAESGILCIPKVGSKVLLHFQNGSPFHPIYQGYTVDTKTKLEEADTNYPNRAVVRFKNGLVVVIDTSTNEIFLRNTGDLHALIEGNLDLTVMGDFTTRVAGSMEQIVNQNRVSRTGQASIDIVTGDRQELTGGSEQSFIRGTSGYYVSGNYTMVASNIYENPNSGAPAAPTEPTQEAPYVWPGINRGGLPNNLWDILQFW